MVCSGREKVHRHVHVHVQIEWTIKIYTVHVHAHTETNATLVPLFTQHSVLKQTVNYVNTNIHTCMWSE